MQLYPIIPQDLRTTASPTFAGGTLSGKLTGTYTAYSAYGDYDIGYDTANLLQYNRAFGATEVGIGAIGRAYNSGATVGTTGHIVGVVGWARDTANGKIDLFGVEGKVSGLGDDCNITGVLGEVKWKGTSFVNRFNVAHNAIVYITEADGSTPLSHGYAIGYYCQPIVGGLLKYSFYGSNPLVITSAADTSKYVHISNDGTDAYILSNGNIYLEAPYIISKGSGILPDADGTKYLGFDNGTSVLRDWGYLYVNNIRSGTGTIDFDNENLTTTGTFSSASGKFSTLTSGRVTYAGTAGLLQDSSDLTYNATGLTCLGTLGVGTAATSQGVISATKSLSHSSLVYGLQGAVTQTFTAGHTGTIGLNFTSKWEPASLGGFPATATMTGHYGCQVGLSSTMPASSAKNMAFTSAYCFVPFSITYDKGATNGGKTMVVTSLYEFACLNPTLSNGAAITTLYGFYDPGLTAATTNWGFYGLTANHFLAALQIGGTPTIGMGAGTLGVTSNITSTAGELRSGVQDTTRGYCRLFGPATGNVWGGSLYLEPAADYDASINAYILSAYEDDFIISNDVQAQIFSIAGADSSVAIKTNGTNSLSRFSIIGYNDQPTYGPELIIQKSNSDTLGTLAETQDGDELGTILVQGVTSTPSVMTGFKIRVVQTGSSGAGLVPANAYLETCTTSGVNSNQLVLTTGGYVGINTAAPSVALEVTGATKVSGLSTLTGGSLTGSATNKTEVSNTGVLTMAGTARVKRDIWISADGFRIPGTKPAAIVDYGIASAWEFSDGTDDTLYARVKLPDDMDKSAAMTIYIGWSTPTGSAGNCRWQVEYLFRQVNEAMDAAADATLVDNFAASTTAKGLVVSTIGTTAVPNASDVCLTMRIKRRADEAADTLGEDNHLHGLCVEYTSNKLGTAL